MSENCSCDRRSRKVGHGCNCVNIKVGTPSDLIKKCFKYAADALNSANRAEESAERAEQAAAQAGYMFFHIDDRGHLIYTRTDGVNVDFYILNGHLFVTGV